MDTLGPRAFVEDELIAWGMKIGSSVRTPLWIAFYGPLGAGKSVLARAVCRGAGVGGLIPSPSFTLVQSYSTGRGFTVHHVDLYRLQPGDPMEPLGWDDLLGDPGLVLLEWADRAGSLQPDDRWEIELDYSEQPDERSVRVRRLGAAAELIGW
jgi:tRNA threonylcarbamoyladenosine biosynthesis protein TsaE